MSRLGLFKFQVSPKTESVLLKQKAARLYYLMDKTFRSNSVGLGVKMKQPGASGSGSASEVGLATTYRPILFL